MTLNLSIINPVSTHVASLTRNLCCVELTRDGFITRQRAFGSCPLQTAQISVNIASYVEPCAHAYSTGRSVPTDLKEPGVVETAMIQPMACPQSG